MSSGSSRSDLHHFDVSAPLAAPEDARRSAQSDEPLPSEIRARSVDDHLRLREGAARLAEHVRACDCAELRAPLAESIAALLEQVRAHLDCEDAALGPLLARIDAWGPVRAAHLAERRRVEVARLAEMLERLAEPMREGPLRDRVLEFVDWLGDELDREEREHLDAALLRDDTWCSDGFGG